MSILSIRNIVERLVRGQTIRRHLPSEFGSKPIIVAPSAALKFLKPGRAAFDPMLLRFCDEHVRADHVVWDIGANIGVFSLSSAQRGAKVLAIEPDVWLGSLLNRTRRQKSNQDLSMEVLCAAISDEPGTASLAIANRGRAGNHLERFEGSSQTGGIYTRQLTPVLTLDMLYKQGRKPDIIKIDVETAELAVLKGASELLKHVKPVILVEVAKTTRDEVAQILDNSGYNLFDFETGTVCDPNAPKGTNLLAIPK